MQLIFRVEGSSTSVLDLDIKDAPIELVRAYELGLLDIQKKIIESQV
jgi:hypothetical protein